MAKKRYGKGGPKGSDYIGNPLGYMADKFQYMQEGGTVEEPFQPYLSEDKTVYYTGPSSGIIRPKGFRNLNQAKRKKKKMDKTKSKANPQIFNEGKV